MNVAIFDYGTGNLHSLLKALENAGVEVRIENELAAALQADALVLPGVGAFGAAAAKLALYAPALRAAIENGHPCLGICLGMQLLFGESEEGKGAGLAIFTGRVRQLRTRRIPHMGWNDVEISTPDPLFAGLPKLLGYYANSFIADGVDQENVLAWTQYEDERFPAVIRRNRTWGVQFHPEKSGAQGLQLIQNFLAAVRA